MNHRKAQGFNLLELLIVLVMFSILALVSAHGLSSLSQKKEKEYLIAELKSIVQYSKAAALNQEGVLLLSPLNTWSKGVMLTNSAHEMLHQWQWNMHYWTVTWRAERREIAFANHPSNAMSNGRFILKNRHNNKEITLILNRMGRVRLEEA